jgi:L-amino acid N-acyltransferase YncA
MEYTIRKFNNGDSRAVIDIFNYYIVNGFAAYTEEVIGYESIKVFKQMTQGYPFYVAEILHGQPAGFSFLRPYQQMEVFRRVAEITYFISPEHTRKGLGELLLKAVIEDARHMGIDSVLASVSSLNEPSLRFHLKNGFTQCGSFQSIGRKFNRDFDMVWMQKMI